MRLSWSEVRGRLGCGAMALIAGASVSLSCSDDDDFTGAGGGTAGSGATAGNDGSAGNGGSAGRGGGSGTGGTAGRSGSGGSAGTSAGSSGASGSSGSAGAGGASGSSGADGGGTNGASGSADGSAGTSGSAGTGGSAGTAGNAGTGGATNCRWGVSGACPTGQYCNALGCESGTCMPLPAEGSTRNPVCGCDDLTYWNASVAGHRGMSVKGTGECPPRTCGGIGTIPCPIEAAWCNMKILTSTLCLATDPAGTCWVLPSACPSGPGIGPNTRACGASACKSECELIRAEQPWYADNTCPM